MYRCYHLQIVYLFCNLETNKTASSIIFMESVVRSFKISHTKIWKSYITILNDPNQNLGFAQKNINHIFNDIML